MSTENEGTEKHGLWPVNPAGGWADCPVCNLNLGIRGVLPETLVPGLRPSLLLSLAAALRASSGEPKRINPEN